MSLLGLLETGGGPNPTHAFGVEFTLPDGKKIETDVAAYLRDQTWALVLGEVKTANEIDDNDIENLVLMQGLLRQKDVRCLLLFATLKPEFSSTEKERLRAHVARSRAIRTPRGSTVPQLPMVFAADDLSRPWGDKEHPWRWKATGGQGGIFGTAEESCRRNLGLEDWQFDSAERDGIVCRWAEPAGASTSASTPS